jgi:hypothetical protein
VARVVSGQVRAWSACASLRSARCVQAAPAIGHHRNGAERLARTWPGRAPRPPAHDAGNATRAARPGLRPERVRFGLARLGVPRPRRPSATTGTAVRRRPSKPEMPPSSSQAPGLRMRPGGSQSLAFGDGLPKTRKRQKKPRTWPGRAPRAPAHSAAIPAQAARPVPRPERVRLDAVHLEAPRPRRPSATTGTALRGCPGPGPVVRHVHSA